MPSGPYAAELKTVSTNLFRAVIGTTECRLYEELQLDVPRGELAASRVYFAATLEYATAITQQILRRLSSYYC